MAEYIATCNSYSDRLYKKNEIVFFEGDPPSKHFKMIDDELPVSEEISDIMPLSFADKSLSDLKELAKQKEITIAGNISREKIISMILDAEKT